jgi:UDP-glucose 4-epimerase
MENKTRYNIYFVSGAAGFIGSNLVDRLLKNGFTVIGYDNFSTGFDKNLEQAEKNPNFTIIHGDVLDLSTLTNAMVGSDFVFHLAANADVRFGTFHPKKDLEQNTIATFNILEAMRANNIANIAFASTGSIYGESNVIPTPEDAPFPIQTSLYGASKLAGEGLIQAYCEGYDFNAWIFRFVSMLGERYSHGHVFDFYKKLLADPKHLHVLGNGKQRKSYLYVQDCIGAMLTTIEKAQNKVNIFNLGTDEYITLDNSIQWISDYLGLNPKITYSGNDRGWIGDNPFIFLDCLQIRELGWKPRLSIKEAVIKTIQYLQHSSHYKF